MEDSLFVIKSVLSADSPNEKLRILLDLCDGHQIFCGQPQKTIKGVVSSINSRLLSKESRHVGMVVLKTFLSQCPDSVFSENVVIWMDQCANDIPIKEAYAVLRIMFQMTSKLAVVPNAVLSNIIPKVLMKICQQQLVNVQSLQCLEAILMHFPKTCKPSLKGVGRLLARACDASDDLVARWAGRCASCVGACAPGGWGEAWVALAAGASDALEALLAMGPAPRVYTAPGRGPKETSASANASTWLRLPPLPSTGGEMRCANALARRYGNITLMMAAMLRCEGAQVKELCAEDLVRLALRALSVRPAVLHVVTLAPEGKGTRWAKEGGGGVAERAALAAALPLVHRHTWHLLTAFVDSCTAGLLKFGPVFCKLVLQTLKWSTVTGSCGAKRPFAKVREAACVFLERWCMRAQAASCVELFGEELIDLLLAQVIPKKEAMVLKVVKQVEEPGVEAGTLQGCTAREGESAAASAALGALAAMVQASGALLGPRIHARMQAACVALELRLRRAGGNEAVPPPPLSSAAARVNLHRLLLALALHPAPRWPAPAPYALRLPADARQDPHPQVRSTAALAATASAQALLHPGRSRCLRFPLEDEDLREAVGLPPVPVSNAATTPPAIDVSTPPVKRAPKRQRQRDTADEASQNREEIVNGHGAAEDEPRKKKKRKNKKKQQQQSPEDVHKPALPSPDTLPKKKQKPAPVDSSSLPVTPTEARHRSTSRASRPRRSAGGDWEVEDRVLPSPSYSPSKKKLPLEAVSTSPSQKKPDEVLHEIKGETQNLRTQAQQSPVVQPGGQSSSSSSTSSPSPPPLPPMHSPQPIVELSPPVTRTTPTSVVIVEMVEEQILCSGQGDDAEWQAPLVDLVDTETDNSMSMEDVCTTAVRDVAKTAESKVEAPEPQVVDLEDTAMEEEVEVLEVEVKAVEVKNKAVDVEEKSAEVKDKTVEVKDTTVEVKDKTVEVKDKTVEVTDKMVEATDKTVEATDKTVEATDKTVEATDKTVEATDKAVEATDKAVEATDKAVEATDKAVEATDKAVEVTDETVEVKDKTVDVGDKTVDVGDKPVKGKDEVIDLENEEVDKQTKALKASASKQMEKKQEGSAEGENREAALPQGTDKCGSKDETPTIQEGEEEDDEVAMLSAFVDVVASDAANQ